MSDKNEPKHFSKEWFDEGKLSILKSVNFLANSLLFVFVIFPFKLCFWLIFFVPIKFCSWLYHHGIEVFKLVFWFCIWFVAFCWIISIFVSIDDEFVITIDGIEIYAVALLPFLYVYFKYLRWELREYYKNRMDRQIWIVTSVASELYEEKKFDELVNYCREEEFKHHDSPQIIYWLALGYYEQGMLENSLELFEKIQTTFPEFKRDVSVYIEKIKSHKYRV